MPTRIRKVRKFRGGRHHGWGQTGGHSGAGRHGGFGSTGGHKHRWTYTVTHEPERFGRIGFYHASAPTTTMNVGELNELAESLLVSGKATKTDEGISIDLNSLKIDKLLGSGPVNKQLLVKVKSSSLKATKKIQDAKGQILKEN